MEITLFPLACIVISSVVGILISVRLRIKAVRNLDQDIRDNLTNKMKRWWTPLIYPFIVLIFTIVFDDILDKNLVNDYFNWNDENVFLYLMIIANFYLPIKHSFSIPIEKRAPLLASNVLCFTSFICFLASMDILLL